VGSDVHPSVAALCEQVDEIGRTAMTLIERLQHERDEYRHLATQLVAEYDEMRSNSEGAYPPPDSGCIECTVGTVPNKWNTGLCVYHKAQFLLEKKR
jgi:hypothetical protein